MSAAEAMVAAWSEAAFIEGWEMGGDPARAELLAVLDDPAASPSMLAAIACGLRGWPAGWVAEALRHPRMPHSVLADAAGRGGGR